MNHKEIKIYQAILENLRSEKQALLERNSLRLSFLYRERSLLIAELGQGEPSHIENLLEEIERENARNQILFSNI